MVLAAQPGEGKKPVAAEGFAARLKKVVDAYGNNSRLAKASGQSEAVIRKWLKGESSPTSDRLLTICRVTGTSMRWLLEGVGTMRQAQPAPPPNTLQSPAASYGTLDAELLAQAIEALERECARLGVDFDAWSVEKRAAAIVEVYERSAPDGAVHQGAVSRVVKLAQ